MSDYTESNYTKTGKKVKSIYVGRDDLTYNEVYDAFIDDKGAEFIIDDVGDKRYWSISDDDYYELVGDVASVTNTTNETKPKFKVGDTVRVTSTDYIRKYDDSIKVGDVGVITNINDNSIDPYKVDFDDNWWFTDKCIELVNDDTESNYTKTCKKVMCINSNRRDLTYKKIYDVFTTQDGVEFIIDDVGDKRYESLEFPYWCEKSDGMVDKANETKHKFKVGDKVKVVDTKQISQWTKDIDVGYVGFVVEVNVNVEDTPYKVKLDKCSYEWWFTDKCIELVSADNTTNKKYNPLVVQQSGNHYKNGEIQPIEYSERNNLSTCQGNIVKYITRHKEKNGVDDLAKIVHYALLEALFVYGEDGATELRDKVDSLINVENKE